MHCKECGRLLIEDGYCAICDGIASDMNLCDYCENEFATCLSEHKYGNGIGEDNVIECNMFKR